MNYALALALALAELCQQQSNFKVGGEGSERTLIRKYFCLHFWQEKWNLQLKLAWNISLCTANLLSFCWFSHYIVHTQFSINMRGKANTLKSRILHSLHRSIAHPMPFCGILLPVESRSRRNRNRLPRVVVVVSSRLHFDIDSNWVLSENDIRNRIHCIFIRPKRPSLCPMLPIQFPQKATQIREFLSLSPYRWIYNL